MTTHPTTGFAHWGIVGTSVRYPPPALGPGPRTWWA